MAEFNTGLNTGFTQEELQRYARHFAVERIGVAGQKKIKNSSVLLIGAGGIGSPAAFYLTAAGIGHLGILDDDRVDLSNLQRQILYSTADLGCLKSEQAAKKLLTQNPHIKITSYPIRLNASNALSIFKSFDLVIDGSDNYPTRYLVNDACVTLKIPLISASIFQFSGQIGVFNLNLNNSNHANPIQTACYRCLYPTPPPTELIPNCAMAGVLGVVPGILATMAVSEALKIILNFPESKPQLIIYDTLGPSLKTYALEKNPHCEICAQNKKFLELNNFQLKINNSCQIHTSQNLSSNLNSNLPTPISAQELADWFKNKDQNKNNFYLLDVRESWEREINSIQPSLHIPLGYLHPDNLNNPDNSELLNILAHQKTSPLIIYCRSGARSQKAGINLIQAGYSNIYNLEGGILAWESL